MIGVKCGSRDLSGDEMMNRDGNDGYDDTENSIMNKNMTDPRSKESLKASDRTVRSL
jgi:hypothetical protein